MSDGSAARGDARATSSRAHEAPPALTAAAWRRRPRKADTWGLEHWPDWLRVIPDSARGQVLIHLFGGLFFALPGAALVISIGVRGSSALALAVLLYVAAQALLHGLRAVRCAGENTVSGPQVLLDRHFPHLSMVSLMVPLAALGSTDANTATLLAGGVLAGLSGPVRTVFVRPRHLLLHPVLQVMATAVMLGCIAVLSVDMAPFAQYLTGAGVLVYLGGLALQRRHPLSPAGVTWSGQMVVGGLLHFITIALLGISAAA
ncbi:TPA: hypothetical protein ACXNP2_003699 [Stenotrophomonas maltophilia]